MILYLAVLQLLVGVRLALAKPPNIVVSVLLFLILWWFSIQGIDLLLLQDNTQLAYPYSITSKFKGSLHYMKASLKARHPTESCPKSQ